MSIDVLHEILKLAPMMLAAGYLIYRFWIRK